MEAPCLAVSPYRLQLSGSRSRRQLLHRYTQHTDLAMALVKAPAQTLASTCVREKNEEVTANITILTCCTICTIQIQHPLTSPSSLQLVTQRLPSRLDHEYIRVENIANQHTVIEHGRPLVAEVSRSPVQSHGTVCLLSCEHLNCLLRR